jgi:hypothetical protein
MRRHLDPWQQPRFLALINIARADAYSSLLARNNSSSGTPGQGNGTPIGDSASTPLMHPLHAPVYSRAGRLLI